MQNNNNNKGISSLIGILIIIAFTIIAVGSVFAYQYFATKSQTPITNVQPNPKSQALNTEVADWKTYTNTEHGFSFNYPSGWVVSLKSNPEWLKGATQSFSICPIGENSCISGSYLIILDHKVDSFNENFKYRGANRENYYYSFINDFPGATDFEVSMYTKIFSTFKFTNVNSDLLSEKSIIDAVDQLEKISLKKNIDGIYEAKVPDIKGGYNINSIVQGDLNGDGLKDAVVHGTMCGASCGSIFTIVLGNSNGLIAFRVAPKYFVSAGAGQYHVDSIKIDDSVISISFNFPDYQGLVSNGTLNYKLFGKELVKLND